MPTERVPVEDRLSVGKRGWVRYQARSIEPTAVFVRFADEEGRLVVRELYVSAEGGPMDPEQVRRLPLGRIEAWVNEPDTAEVVRRHMPFPGADLRRAIAFYATTFGRRRDREGKPAEPHWVERMHLAQIEGSGEPQPPMRDLSKPLGAIEIEMPDLPDARLDVPTGRPYPNEFFNDVATVYSALAAITRAPAGFIADANHVPVSSVHRWVKRARALGFLPPGQRGRAG
jgi:hypothetical protein